MRIRRLFWRLIFVSVLVAAVACGGEQRQPGTDDAANDYVLIYEPDTGTRFQATFGTAVTENAVMRAVAELGITDAEVVSRDGNTVEIKTALLDPAGRQELQATLANLFGPITNFQVTETQSTTADQMQGAVDLIYRRLTLLEIEEASVQRSGATRVLVRIPAAEVIGSIEEIKALIGQTAKLEFKERTCADPSCLRYNDTDIGLSGDDLATASPVPLAIGVGWGVNIQFNGRGTEIFSDLTWRIESQNEKRIAVSLDDVLLIAPVVRAWIRDGRVIISGDFTQEESRILAIQLQSGRLPVPLKLVEEQLSAR